MLLLNIFIVYEIRNLMKYTEAKIYLPKARSTHTKKYTYAKEFGVCILYYFKYHYYYCYYYFIM